MKQYFATVSALIICFGLLASAEGSTKTKSEPKAKKQVQYNEKGEAIKTGLNFGPLPAVAFDADKGFQVGAILNIYNYGDGSTYPNTMSKWYLEASYFTKGSQLYTIQYDDKCLIPGVRWSSTATLSVDKAFDFYGFNGYQSNYDFNRVDLGKANKGSKKEAGPQDPANFLYNPFYKTNRVRLYVKSDFIGKITDNFYWQAGYHFRYIRQTPINRSSINKGKPEYNMFPTETIDINGHSVNKTPTLFEQYRNWGLVSTEESVDNAFTSSLRLGLMYDSRDKEGAPTRGIWTEAHIEAGPKWLGNTLPYYRYSFSFRNYIPLVDNDILTFAYRINYEGTIGKSCPHYVLPYMTVVGDDSDYDGFGSYRTCRGIMRARVVGLDEAGYNAEFRYRFVKFMLWKQNISFGLSLFSDGCMVTRKRSMDFNDSNLRALGIDETHPYYIQQKADYDRYMAGLSSAAMDNTDARSSERAKHIGKDGYLKEIPHITTGLGLRFIMNENFIVAFEYGMPVSRFYSKTSPYFRQDGDGAFYINLGYLF